MLVSNSERLLTGKATHINLSNKSTWRLSSIAFKIMTLVKHHVSIMELTGCITYVRRCNWIWCLIVLHWMCGSFLLVDLVYFFQSQMSFFVMSLSCTSSKWLCLLILYFTRHVTCAMTLGKNLKVQRQMPLSGGLRPVLKSIN